MTTFIAACIGLGQPTHQLPAPRALQPICREGTKHLSQQPLYKKILEGLDNEQRGRLKDLMKKFQEKKQMLKEEKVRLAEDACASDSECNSEFTLELKDAMRQIICRTQNLLTEADIEIDNDVPIDVRILQNAVLWRRLNGQDLLAYTDQDPAYRN